MRSLRVLAALIAHGIIGGCAGSPQTRLRLDNPPDVPPRVELVEVPFFPQQEYHCGPSSLASVVNYRGTPVVPEQIAQMIYVPGLKGSLQIEVVAAVRQFEMLPVQLNGKLHSLLIELAAGNPIFVLQNLGLDSFPVWHYEVVVGYDLDEEIMILRSGVDERVIRSFALFEKTWRRAGYWALAIVKADMIPVSVGADAYLDAVVGMEQVGQIAISRQAYSTAVQRWPDSLLAYSGLGNSAYAMGEFKAAESAYRSALMIDPQKAEIWNNLAYVMLQLGDREASMEAISRALELDPENQNFRDSYNELTNWQ